MRRKAIKLANLRKCVTHSTQTVFSNFKRENETQVYLPKDNWGQTKRDGDTSVPKLKTYYHGLRYIFSFLQPADCFFQRKNRTWIIQTNRHYRLSRS